MVKKKFSFFGLHRKLNKWVKKGENSREKTEEASTFHRPYLSTKDMWVFCCPIHKNKICMYVCIYRVQNVFLRCPTRRLHYFPSSHWPSFRFLSFTAFFIPSIQFFFGLPRALFCFGIHFNAILGSLSSAILWTRPYHVSRFCSISFIIVSSSPICCLIVTFLILSFLDILKDLLRTSISVPSTRLLLFSVSLHVSAPYNKLLLISAL